MRTRLLLLTLGLLGATAGVVYLAVTLSSPPRVEAPEAVAPAPIRPITTPGSIITTGPREGSRAPSFTAPRFDGETLSLSDLRGKGVVMNFFASWCPPCRVEARDLEATYRKYRTRGVVFLGVDIHQDTWEDARGFLKEFGITYLAVRDERAEIAKAYQLFGLPTTYFIDKDGVIRSKVAGPFLGPEGLKELERRIGMILP